MMTGRFSFSASSNGLWGATKGSGVQSSTSSSISCGGLLDRKELSLEYDPHLVCKCHVAFFLRRVARGHQISNGKQ